MCNLIKINDCNIHIKENVIMLHVRPENKLASNFVEYILDFGRQVEACIRAEVPFTVVDDNGNELYHCIPVRDSLPAADDDSDGDPIPLGVEIGLF